MKRIEEDYVDYELALLLKELDFNIETYKYYDIDYPDADNEPFMNFSNHNVFNDTASCPDIYTAQKWLREEHDIVVETWCNASGYNCDICKTNGVSIKNFEYCENSNDGGMFDKYEDALMNALKWACRYIIKLKP